MNVDPMNPTPGAPDLSAVGWQQRYDDDQTGWDRGEPSPALLRWLESGELKPGRVFVPGCGRGHEVVELARRGFEVAAVDFAKSAVQTLTKRLVEEGLIADIAQESVLNYSAEDPFDAIYEQTCLCALDPKHWAAYAGRLHASLKVGGKLFALFMQTDAPAGPPFRCDLNAMKELFDGERWSWSAEQFVVGHPAGMQEIATVLTKKES